MRLRPEHLHPVFEIFNFKLPRFGELQISDTEGWNFCSTSSATLPYLPADHFKLYVRFGMVAKLVTDLDLRSLKIAVEIECAKQGISVSDIPRMGEYIPHYHAQVQPESQPKEVVGGGVSQSQIRREMRMMLAPGSHTKREWREVMQRDGWKCLRCGSTKRLSKDHVVPIAGGGTNGADNLQTLCTPCNSWKGARHIDFRPQAEVIAQN